MDEWCWEGRIPQWGLVLDTPIKSKIEEVCWTPGARSAATQNTCQAGQIRINEAHGCQKRNAHTSRLFRWRTAANLLTEQNKQNGFPLTKKKKKLKY